MLVSVFKTVGWPPDAARRGLDHMSLTMPQSSLGLFMWVLQGSKKGPSSKVPYFPLHCILHSKSQGRPFQGGEIDPMSCWEER